MLNSDKQFRHFVSRSELYAVRLRKYNMQQQEEEERGQERERRALKMDQLL